MCGSTVYLLHHSYLSCLFTVYRSVLRLCLIDTDGVQPDKLRLEIRAAPLKDIVDVPSNQKSHTIDYDGMLSLWPMIPSIRYRVVLRDVANVARDELSRDVAERASCVKFQESNLSILFQGWCERVGKCGRRWAYHIGDESFREYCSVQYESKCHTRYVDEVGWDNE